jgi:hypothetical protein
MEPVDPGKKHFYISLVKSALRLLGCYLLWSAGAVMGDVAGIFVQWSAFALAAAEGLGILEEL